MGRKIVWLAVRWVGAPSARRLENRRLEVFGVESLSEALGLLA